jgi:hypothetical protein
MMYSPLDDTLGHFRTDFVRFRLSSFSDQILPKNLLESLKMTYPPR